MGGYVPLGYEADGRTLKVNEEEAQTVKILYDLYLKHRLIRLVKDDAEKLNLRSKVRVRSKGKMRGGNRFARGHIHHILTNPVYAGRIRHKGKVYDGQHPAIIDPDVWDEIQNLLIQKAPYKRGQDLRITEPSLLIGKAYDETGDRLSPSHSQKNGKRLRYYISHRLSKKIEKGAIAGWRIPAQPFEDQITAAVSTYLNENITSNLLINPSIDVIQNTIKVIKANEGNATRVAPLINRIDIAPGSVEIRLDHEVVCEEFNLNETGINPDALTFSLPFQTRKRGVETKLIIGHVAPYKDETLIRNLAIAHKWLNLIKAGISLDAICAQDKTSRRRIQQVIKFAFLAPDIVQMIIEGRQPIKLTSVWVSRNIIPNDWHDQRALIASL